MTIEDIFKQGVVPDPVPAVMPYIPRIIWQTTKNRFQIAAPLMQCVENVKSMNPGWEHRLFDDETQLAFLSSVCSDRFMRAYNRIEPKYGAARADIFRYVAVYLHGGIYMDMKSGTKRPLDDILRPDDQFIFSQWDNGPEGILPGVGMRRSLRRVPGGEYEQWFVCAAPGHPYLANVLEMALSNIENFNPFIFRHGSDSVLDVMGPTVFTFGIWSIQQLHPHRRISSWKDGLRYTMLKGMQSHHGHIQAHYSQFDLPSVTALGLEGMPLLRYRLLMLLYWPLRTVRELNHRRLDRRGAKRPKKTINLPQD